MLKNWADATFGDSAGLIALAVIALLGAVLIALSRVVSPAVRETDGVGLDTTKTPARQR